MQPRSNVRLACCGQHLFTEAQLRVSLTLRHIFSHGGTAGNECADHAAALGTVEPAIISLTGGLPPRFNTTLLIDDTAHLADIEPLRHNGRHYHIRHQQAHAPR